MSEILASLLKKIEKRVRADDPEAVQQATRLAAQYPESVEVWVLLAFAHARQDEVADAVTAITRAIELSPPEPGIFFDRGRYALKLADYHRALDDFTQGLVLCEQLKNDYYRQALRFFRAEVFLKLGMKREARADLDGLPDDFTLWTTKLRTKEALLAECASNGSAR
jgi:tetratricopeptide (TPR) repeat protein